MVGCRYGTKAPAPPPRGLLGGVGAASPPAGRLILPMTRVVRRSRRLRVPPLDTGRCEHRNPTKPPRANPVPNGGQQRTGALESRGRKRPPQAVGGPLECSARRRSYESFLKERGPVGLDPESVASLVSAHRELPETATSICPETATLSRKVASIGRSHRRCVAPDVAVEPAGPGEHQPVLANEAPHFITSGWSASAKARPWHPSVSTGPVPASARVRRSSPVSSRLRLTSAAGRRLSRASGTGRRMVRVVGCGWRRVGAGGPGK